MREWLAGDGGGDSDVVVIGAPISKASISPSQAWTTPAAFRAALSRFPTWDAGAAVDVTELRAHDAGDIEGDQADVDATAAHLRIEQAIAGLTAAAVVVIIGGDNSLTRPAFLGAQRAHPARSYGLLTLDAHHDCRPVINGSANGTPVRELIEGGLPGHRVAQVGIHPLGNAGDQARWARAQGIHIHGVDEVRREGIEVAVGTALDELRASGCEAIYVDLDVDVVDRAFAPGCPASLPGGIFAHDLLAAARLLGRQDDVTTVDLCEVDAAADVAGTTVRLMAATFTALCAGIAVRAHPASA